MLSLKKTKAQRVSKKSYIDQDLLWTPPITKLIVEVKSNLLLNISS